VITGDIVWAADTAGRLSALDLHTGEELWHTALAVPVLAGLAVSGDWLVVASFDGTVRGLARTASAPIAPAPATCEVGRAGAGCCDTGGAPAGPAALLLAVGLVLRRGARRARTRVRA
jgi:hypothetical protein